MNKALHLAPIKYRLDKVTHQGWYARCFFTVQNAQGQPSRFPGNRIIARDEAPSRANPDVRFVVGDDRPVRCHGYLRNHVTRYIDSSFSIAIEGCVDDCGVDRQ